MFEVDKMSSFFTKLSKNNMGGITGGASDIPMMPPMLFFSKNKNYLSNKMHSFFSKNKNNMGGGGHQTLPTLHPPPTTSLTSTPHTPPPLMPDISWAPPHSLPIW